jgi:hypothetical protein
MVRVYSHTRVCIFSYAYVCSWVRVGELPAFSLLLLIHLKYYILIATKIAVNSEVHGLCEMCRYFPLSLSSSMEAPRRGLLWLTSRSVDKAQTERGGRDGAVLICYFSFFLALKPTIHASRMVLLRYIERGMVLTSRCSFRIIFLVWV